MVWECMHQSFCFVCTFLNLPLCFRYSVIEDGSLVIRKLRMEDSGMFQCLAANEAGEDSVYTWLKVKSKTLNIFINQVMVLLQSVQSDAAY